MAEHADHHNEHDHADHHGAHSHQGNSGDGSSPNRYGYGWTGWLGVVSALILSLLVTSLLTYMLIAFWPDQNGGWKTVWFFGASFGVGHDTALFIVVLLAGALGGMVHTLRSLTWHFGSGNLRHRWLLMYCALPGVGGLLALLFYLLLRGGLLTAQTSTKDINVYGFAAIAGVVGFASEQAARKLIDVFSTLFAPAPQGPDPDPSGGGDDTPGARVDGGKPPPGGVGGAEQGGVPGQGGEAGQSGTGQSGATGTRQGGASAGGQGATGDAGQDPTSRGAH